MIGLGHLGGSVSEASDPCYQLRSWSQGCDFKLPALGSVLEKKKKKKSICVSVKTGLLCGYLK